VRRFAYSLAEATPALIAFGPVATLAGILTARLACFRRTPAA
jgi:hypothetical protein